MCILTFTTMHMIFNVKNKSDIMLARRPEPQIGESAYPVSPIGNFGTFR